MTQERLGRADGRAGTIIFDYNRTLYDPERAGFYPGVPELVKRLARAYELCLVGRNEPGRSDCVYGSGLGPCFSVVRFVDEKTAKVFKEVAQGAPSPVFVVGDRVREEIRIGNALGYRTIWVQQGKFAGELPQGRAEEPLFTVSGILDIETVL